MAQAKHRATTRTTLAPGIARTLRARLPVYLAWIVYGLMLGLSVGGWLVYALQQPDVLQYAYRYDFLTMYVGARTVASGQGAALYDLAVNQQIGQAAIAPFAQPSMMYAFVYPPYDAVLFAPLGFLSYPLAFVFWSILNCLLAAVAVGRLVGATATTGGERLALLLAAAGFMPLLLTLLQGQTGIVALLSLTGAALTLRAGQERPSGAWLLLGLIKPQLIALPVFGLLVSRRWRPLLVFASGAGGILAISFAVLGNWLPGQWMALLGGNANQGAGFQDFPIAMQNWRALIYALLGSDTSLPASILLFGLSAASLALVVWLCWPRAGRSQAEWEVRWAVVMLLGILVVPHLYLHDVVVALVPGVLLWRASSRALASPQPGAEERRRHLLRWLLGVGPLVFFAAQFWEGVHTPIQIGPWYLALLVMVAILSFEF